MTKIQQPKPLTLDMWRGMRDPLPLIEVVAYSGGKMIGFHAAIKELPEEIAPEQLLEEICIGLPPAQMTLRAIVEDGYGNPDHVTHAAIFLSSDLDEPPAAVAELVFKPRTGHYRVTGWIPRSNGNQGQLRKGGLER